MDTEALNKDIRQWGRVTARKLVRQVASLTLKDRFALRKSVLNAARDPEYKKLVKSIGPGYGKSFGQVDRINFRFSRHGIFFERGVGGKRGGGTVKRTPNPWIAPILAPAIEDLADLLADKYADQVVAEINISVPGILSARIKVDNGQ